MNGRVISLGQMLVDLTMHVDRIPEPGGDAFADEAVAHVGSSFNILHAVRRMGVQASHGGIIGTGPWAQRIRAALADDGIDHIGLTDATRDSGLCIAVTDRNAERTFITVRGAETQGDARCFDAIEPGDADIVHINGYTFAHPTSRGLLRFLERTRDHAFRALFDPSSVCAGADRRLLDAIVDYRPMWSCNRDEAVALARRFGVLGQGESDPFGVDADGAGGGATGGPAWLCWALADHLAAPVIVRAGSRGAWVCADPAEGTAVRIASPAVRAVDTNGAGDCHAGVVCAGLMRGLGLAEAVREANVAAAVSVTRRGPATCPTREEMRAFAAEGGFPLAVL